MRTRRSNRFGAAERGGNLTDGGGSVGAPRRCGGDSSRRAGNHGGAVRAAVSLSYPRTAYNVGFSVYWAGWCLAVPLWLLGPRTITRLLITGRRLSLAHGGTAGAARCRRDRHTVDPAPPPSFDAATAVTMVGTAVVNAIGEELLWRGLFMRVLADDCGRRSCGR